MKKIISLILLLFVLTNGQVVLTRNYFYDLQAYSLLDFDFENGLNNPNFFSYTLSYHSPDNQPTELAIEMSFTATLPSFGFQNTNIAYVKTKPFEFLGTFNITSMDIDQNLDKAYYADTDEEIDFHGSEIEEFIEESDFNKIRDNVLATGELPVGQYLLTIKVFEKGLLAGDDQKIITISSTSSLELIEPGEEELSVDEGINTTFPIFRWDTDPVRYDEAYCDECGIYIRVAEYKPDEHGSLQDALSDEASLPFPDNGEFVKLAALNSESGTSETVNNFIYPVSGARALERGHYYVWQLKKKFPTTAGFDEKESSLFVFKIADEQTGDLNDENTQLVNSIVVKMIENLDPGLLADYEKELENYQFTGEILLGNESISADDFKAILDKINSKQYKLESISIK